METSKNTTGGQPTDPKAPVHPTPLAVLWHVSGARLAHRKGGPGPQDYRGRRLPDIERWPGVSLI